MLSPDQEDILRDNIEYLPDPDETESQADYEGPQVFRLSGQGELGGSGKLTTPMWSCWVAASRPRQPLWDKVDDEGEPLPLPNLIILEFELESDTFNPLSREYEDDDSDSELTTDSDTSWTNLSNASKGDSSSSQHPVSPHGASPQTSFSESGAFQHMPSAERAVTLGTARSNQTGSRPLSAGSGRTSVASSSRQRQPMGLEGPEDYAPPLERILESTTNHAKPIRTLQRVRRSNRSDSSPSIEQTSSSTSSAKQSQRSSYRRRRPARPKGAGADAIDVFAVLNQINEQLNAAPDLETFLNITVGVVKDLSRFHRVLVYQFDEAMNGKVVTELVNLQKTDDLFKGLMFPAADIPPQARKLYLINKVRFLYDGSQPTARLVLRDKSDLDYPLDMTHCYLRAMSPIHLKCE